MLHLLNIPLAIAGAEHCNLLEPCTSDVGSNSSKGSETGDVKDDIASRKKEAQQWISEWREATGGK